jgi:hypothetical protein
MTMNPGELIFLSLVGLVVILAIGQRIYCALTQRSPLSPAQLQRINATLKKWDAVVERDWSLLLARIKEITTDTSDEQGISKRLALFIMGMLALLIIIPVALMNVVILSQILELFVPGGAETLTIPFLGDFIPIALVFAIMIAGVEAIAAVAIWHAPRKAMRIFAGVMGVVMVAVEAGGGYMRARLMHGSDDVSRSMMGFLAQQDGVISALFSLAAPLAEMIASVLIFEGVFIPLSYHGLRVFRIIPVNIFRGVGYLLYGPFLQSPYMDDPKIEETEMADQEPTPLAPPTIMDIIENADHVSQFMLDEAVALKTGTQALSLAFTGLLGGIASFIVSKVKHGPSRVNNVNPRVTVDEFSRVLEEARAQSIYQECQAMARETTPRNPVQVYAGYNSAMLQEEKDAFDRKRNRLSMVVRLPVRGALALAITQLDRIKQTDSLLWSQDPEAKLEWGGIQQLQLTLESQYQQQEQSLTQTITRRREALQGLNDLVESPLIAEMDERSRAENLRHIKMIVTRLGCNPAREGFAALDRLFQDHQPVQGDETVALRMESGSSWLSRAKAVVQERCQTVPTDDENLMAAGGRDTARLLLHQAEKALHASCDQLEGARTRAHEVADQLIEIHCEECPDALCAMCPRCEQFKLNMHNQAAEIEEDCAEYERILTVRMAQIEMLLKRKTFWGRLFAWVDDWKEGTQG